MKMDQKMLEDALYQYAPQYNEIDFIRKLSPLTQQVGLRELVLKALKLWFLWQEDLNTAERSVIAGALGYFIVVVDLIPDTIIGGYCDDVLILSYGLQLLATRITPELEARAEAFSQKWLAK